MAVENPWGTSEGVGKDVRELTNTLTGSWQAGSASGLSATLLPMAKRWGKKKKSAGIRALDLERKLDELGPVACFLVTGGESFLEASVLRLLRDRLVGDNPGPSYSEYDGRKAKIAEVLDEARTLPFFGQGHRLVVVRNATQGSPQNQKGFLAGHGEALQAYLENPPDTSTLVLVAPKVDKRLKSTKALEKLVKTVDAGAFDEAELLRFMRQRAKHWGKPFARGADMVLLERLGGQDVDLATLDAEVAKLAAGAGDAGITRTEVEALASVGSSEQSFGLIDRIGRGDIQGALGLLQVILRDGLIGMGGTRTRDPSGITMILLPTLRWDLTRLLRARTLLESGTPANQITRELRVFRDKHRFMNRVRRTTHGGLARRHAWLRRADLLLKNSGDPRGLLTDTVLQLALSERAG